MNILVLTKDAKHQEEVFTQDLLGFISKNVDGICQFKRHEYNDDPVKLYRAIDRNDVQVIFIDDDRIREIADKILTNYGRNCPDLVGFSAISGHEQNPAIMEDISRYYDYVYSKSSAKGLYNYLRRKVIRYKSKHGELGLITRNLNGFFFNNKSITLVGRELRFLTVLFDKKDAENCTHWNDFCDKFEYIFDCERKVSCNHVEDSSAMMLNRKLKDVVQRLNKTLKLMAEGDGFKLEGHDEYKNLIETEGSKLDCIWCYRNKIEASKKDICND